MRRQGWRARLGEARRTAEAVVAAAGLGPRLFGQAILHPGHFAAVGRPQDGLNINGPSVVAVPDFVSPEARAHPSARYYLYFAHHVGRYIRMAWAPAPEGPFTLYNVGRRRDPRRPGEGVFDLAEYTAGRLALDGGARIQASPQHPLHVASPDVHVDPERRRFVLFAHAPMAGAPWGQGTFATTSPDGLGFGPPHPVALGPAYLRVFRWQGRAYAVGMGGRLHVGPEGDAFGLGARWTAGPVLLEAPPGTPSDERGPWPAAVARHVAVVVDEAQARLTIYFTRALDAPERILAVDVALEGAPEGWRGGVVREVHRATAEWEGAGYPARPSGGGVAAGGVNQLRDPFVLVVQGGLRYLYYAVQGELALGCRGDGAQR